MDWEAQIRHRIAELQAERTTVVQAAAQQAARPYDSAIGELQRLLALCDAPTINEQEIQPHGTVST